MIKKCGDTCRNKKQTIFTKIETVFSTLKESLADKKNMKQERSTALVHNTAPGKPKYSGYHSKISPCCVPLLNLPWKSPISDGSP